MLLKQLIVFTMNNLCIIPARGGSKRIPRKNIKLFKGKPIISYSIDLALKSNLFCEIMVSTDDPEIADTAIKFNATIPFYRSNNTSNDLCGLSDVIMEVLNEYRKRGKTFDNVCCILATAPLIQIEDLLNSYNVLLSNKFESVYPIVEYSYPILRSLILMDDNLIKMKWPEYSQSRSQDLERFYHDSGSFYWINAKKFLEKGSFDELSCGGYPIDEIKSQDIDNETDWNLAEIKYDFLKNL